jgi:hypothetical protein
MFSYPPHDDGNYYTPYAWIDGFIRGGYYFNNWWDSVNVRSQVESPVNITLGGEYNWEFKEGTLDISITAEEPIAWRGLKLRVALTEDSIYYQAPNGTNWHNFTLRDMIPDAAGMPVEISQGETVQFQQSFICPAPLRPDYCRLVAWLQADSSDLEILQTSKIMINELEAVDITDEAALPDYFSLSQNYPNPFNAKTTIEYSLSREGHVNLEVFDILGSGVVTLVDLQQGVGNYRVVWDGQDKLAKVVGSGIYFYRLSIEGRTIGRQMLLLK